MTDAHAEPRHNQTPYAALHTAPDSAASRAGHPAPGNAPAADPNYLAAEADKLESFKQALYAAFIAAPISGIPTALVDLAATYTSALRLQLSLRGYSAVPKQAVRAPIVTPRTKT